MNLNIDDNEIAVEFRQKLRWFEEEFDLIIKNNADIRLANHILEKLSETITEYRDEKLIFPLVSTLKNIEKKHPAFF